MEKKYKLTDETINVCGKKLCRIEALKDFIDVEMGDKGGFIDSETNLSQVGNAWVYYNAKVCDHACVSGNSHVYGEAKVWGFAKISGNAEVFGNANVSGYACVSGNADVYDNDDYKYENINVNNPLNIECIQDYIYVIYPADSEFMFNLTMSGFPVPMEPVDTTTIQDYYILKSVNQYDGNFNITI